MSFSELKYIPMIIPVGAVIVALVVGYIKKNKILVSLQMKRQSLDIVKRGLMVIGLLSMLVALLGPISNGKPVEIEEDHLDMYILLDVSKSMLVEDIAPDRLSHEKRIVEELLDNLKGDRVGFIPFAASAYVQMPLTDDYQMARMFLDVIDTDVIGGGGTDMATAIRLAGESFGRVSGGDKVVIIISDGEDQKDFDASILDYIKKNDLIVYSIGVGTEEGGLIPEYDSLSDKQTGYKKDKNGSAVVSKLNDDLLKQVAKAGHGDYYQASLQGGEIEKLLPNIAFLEKSQDGVRERKQFKHWYQYPLGLGLLLFLLGYIDFRRPTIHRSVRQANNKIGVNND
ncbi:VWA domain-containing protein [Acidaminobacter sp. JC074]|uniref:vWA domain-containing protein n=1 Tax=Acidaminobacter sp. JC074 TaxID=2530199 RepID=UPI001F1073EF|nr:VWA domain-containing protein [Acidaminobacter sp. JC074]MCH4886045.1 VWA domain-containing protein [Acidaminobacter sp. JC074]